MSVIRKSTAPSLVLCLCFAWAPAVTGYGQQIDPTNPPPASRLIDLLRSDAPVYDKAMACRGLSINGDESAVPVLASLLADPQLATYARSALEAIPGQAADRALRNAIGNLEGELRIGVLDSIGNRRDQGSIDALAPLLQDSDAAVAAAAARALGSIGNLRTAGILQDALTAAPAPRRPAIANACLINADLLFSTSSAAPAAGLYDAVLAADLPQHLQLAAMQRAILTQGDRGLALLADQLASEQQNRFRLALQTARQLGSDAAELLIQHYPQNSAARQTMIVLALGDIGDPAALPLLRRAAQGGDPNVRAQAIAALGRLNDTAAVEVLVNASADPDPSIAAAARLALSRLESDRIESVVSERLASDDRRILLAAIDVARGRRMTSATPVLLRLVRHDDRDIRSAAISALGWTVGVDNLPQLIDLVVTAADARDRQAAIESLSAACARLPRPQCVERLSAAMDRTSGETKLLLLEQIAAVGGPEALQIVAAQAGAADDAMQDAATRLLGQWLSADVAPQLLQLAKTLQEPKYKIRVLRGYVRCARQLDMSPEQRLEVCRNVLAVADRTEEKLLIFEVLRRYPSPQGLQLASDLLSDPQLRDTAARTILETAGSVGETAPQQAQAALQAVAQSATDPALKQQAADQLSKR